LEAESHASLEARNFAYPISASFGGIDQYTPLQLGGSAYTLNGMND
jgi:hypothetical protein